ncbi:MAG: acyl-CoA dehydrogenase family protein, partial [Deltaproteobacteria bacterium]|nr:acyl-CoA dehydrogenase family protein [Deltaproteobacteria bacterium]
IRTTARLDGDAYVLDGLKHFITNGPAADYVTVIALTDPPKRAKGMSVFIVERGTPGFEVSRIQETMGPRGYHQAELVFDGCRVPKDNLVGEPGTGFKTAMRCLNEGRISMAVASIGASQRLLHEATAYAKARVQFGKPIAAQQAIQFMLSDMATEHFASRAMTLEAAWQVERNPRNNQYSSMAKLFASEAAGRIADRAVQIFGGMGYMKELPVERLYREVRLHRIVEGTSEIQRLIIARELLRD